MCRAALFCALLAAGAPMSAQAAVLSFASTVQADYEFSILGGTPINPGSTTPFIPFRAIGNLTFELSPLLNDPSMPTSVPFVDVTGVLDGIPPSPPPTLPHVISPNLEFIGGDLINIVRDGSGNVVSADVSGLEMRWTLVGSSPMFPVTLYTQEGLPFDATNVSIPFQPGTVLAGAAPFNIYLDDGDGDPSNDSLVAIGQNRTLTVTAAVPEPSSAVVMIGLIGSAAFARRLRRFRIRRQSKPRL
jgi:hypothetical protein